MKHLAQERGRQRFDVVVLGAAAPAEGRAVFSNLRQVACRHLGAEPELLGCLAARDDAFSCGQALAEAFLERSCGTARTAPFRAARSATAAYPLVV
jgi:hypothetical protein